MLPSRSCPHLNLGQRSLRSAVAEVLAGGEGRRATAAIRRAFGGYRAGFRLLGHDLEPLREVDAAGAAAQVAASGLEFFCPMHPHVVQDEPGSARFAACRFRSGARARKCRLPTGVTARVQLKPAQVEQAGIGTVEVDYAPLTETIRTVGYVAVDERRMANIVSKVPGKSRVERLFANVTGMEVVAGSATPGAL